MIPYSLKKFFAGDINSLNLLVSQGIWLSPFMLAGMAVKSNLTGCKFKLKSKNSFLVCSRTISLIPCTNFGS